MSYKFVFTGYFYVAKSARSADSDLLRLHAQRANTIRQNMLKDMKQHRLLVPQSVSDAVANLTRKTDDDTSTSDNSCLFDFVKNEFSQKLLEMWYFE